MTSISDSLRNAESVLAANGIADSAREAVSLVMLATRRDRTFVYAHPEHVLSNDEITALHSMLRRRASREPLQYISGVQEFYGLKFDVSPDVLIPRPETEMVVEHAINFLRERATQVFCEVGIGSGCIAISILHQVPGSNAVGMDISGTAIGIAKRNSEKHRVADRLRLVESDVFIGLGDERFDLIVSNPPYIPLKEIGGLQAEVRDFEPLRALTDGGEGLSIIGRIVSQAPQFLSTNGALLMEIGLNQPDPVVEIFDTRIWRRPSLFPDLQGIPRLVFGELI